jgi:hypothetical protein
MKRETSEVIDISDGDDDDSVKITGSSSSFRRTAQQPQQDLILTQTIEFPKPPVVTPAPLVCYGMIESPIYNLDHLLIAQDCRQTEKYTAVKMKANVIPGKAYYSLDFYKQEGFILARLNDGLCEILHPMLALMRFDSRIHPKVLKFTDH